MAYVYRIQKEGVNTLEGWQNSQKYGREAIDQIKDPDGATATKEITSIPSPFARMDLVKTAFREVSKIDDKGNYVNIDGKTIFHKMVSDTLDVAQIFFEYNKWSDQLQIIPWDAQADVRALLESENPGQNQLGQTYQLYLQQDARNYNFGQLQRIYLLNYIGDGAQDAINIIGATSPATLFFSSANNFEYVGEHISFGQDCPFDNRYNPLYKRDFEFFKYFWNLSLSIPNFGTLFPEIYAYLQACFSASTDERKAELRALNGDLTMYDPIDIDGNAGYSVEVLGYPMKKLRPNIVNIQANSDFVIKSEVYQGPTPPLVLPVEMFTARLVYVRDIWDSKTKVPYSVSEDLTNRVLPNDGSVYPFLTISDFLEDYLIRTPYEMSAQNKENYFDGNTLSKNQFLLPIKDRFFEYFTAQQLYGKVGGKNMFEMESNAGGIAVTLRIPIKNDRCIEYHRTYFENNEPQILTNRGAIKEYDFALAMVPNARFANPAQAYYRLGFIHGFRDTSTYEVLCKQGSVVVSDQGFVRNENDSRYLKGHVYSVNGSNFDYIRIKCDQMSGIVVPKFKEVNGRNRYKFAVDFGTTNTHIEYSVNESPTQEFNMSADDSQIRLLAEYSRAHEIVFESEFIPSIIGQDSKYNFPMRTAMTESRITNWEQPVFPMVQAGFAFTYEKLLEYAYNRIITNLKWSNDVNNIQKVTCYIESLMMLLRNKVLLNGGTLEETEIVWFYPISMSQARYGQFKQVWENAYTKYFGPKIGHITPMTESVAPYEYYKKSNTKVNNIVTIDIGGGTTDVVIAENERVQNITSFRFAANAIFGDAFADNNGTQNGIVRQFKYRLRRILEQNDNTETQLRNVFDQLDAANNSADIASFLFSLKDNVTNRGLRNLIDFNAILLADETQKMSFIIFYTAIIYHVAHIMRNRGLQMPRHIAFSGNGSKVISILTPDETTLQTLTRRIFERIYGEAYGNDGLTVLHRQDQPKEATCKGGLVCNVIQPYLDIQDLKLVLDSASMDEFVQRGFTYEQVDDDYLKNTVLQVKNFLDFVFDLNDELHFNNMLGVDAKSIQIAKDVCYRDLLTFANRGLRNRLNEVDATDEIEETLFFYPLVGVLNVLAEAICEQNTNQ